MIFQDRREAGRKLADKLHDYRNMPELLVLALPRGGVPVGFEVARALNAPLDVFVVRKLGLPGHEELAMGAIASGGVRVMNDSVLRHADVPQSMIDAVTAREQSELARREQLYRGGRPPLQVEGRTVLLVDDGLATGSTLRAAIAALRRMHVGKLVVAAPVGAPDTCVQLLREADDVICAQTPWPFHGVGQWYVYFDQTSDEEVQALLAQSQSQVPSPSPSATMSAPADRYDWL